MAYNKVRFERSAPAHQPSTKPSTSLPEPQPRRPHTRRPLHVQPDALWSQPQPLVDRSSHQRTRGLPPLRDQDEIAQAGVRQQQTARASSAEAEQATSLIDMTSSWNTKNTKAIKEGGDALKQQ